jgi:hypothetical protein
MKKINKWWYVILVSVILIIPVLLVLDSSNYDNKRKLSEAMIYQGDGTLNERAFAGAIMGRFPQGGEPGALKTFIKSIGGTCLPEKGGKFSCSVDETGSFCVATKISVEVQLDDAGKIKFIGARSYFVGC